MKALSGKSKSNEYPYGQRRTIGGIILAPRGVRNKIGKRFIDDVTNGECIAFSKMQKIELMRPHMTADQYRIALEDKTYA